MFKASEEQNNDEFSYFLSAFLTSARSILQYTFDHAGSVRRTSDYNKLVSKDPILTFFKDKRDINIHSTPIDLVKEVRIDVASFLIVRDPNSNSTPKSIQIENHNPEISTTFKFEDWKGDENVLELSKLYVQRLETFITEAKSIDLIG